MVAAPEFPPRLILTGAMVLGLLLALSVHILGVRIGLDLGGLWAPDSRGLMPASAAAGWWLVAGAGLVSGFVTASIMSRAASGRIPLRVRQALIATAVVIFAAAGGAASGAGGGSPLPTASGVIAGLTALGLGALMAFFGATFALRRT